MLEQRLRLGVNSRAEVEEQVLAIAGERAPPTSPSSCFSIMDTAEGVRPIRCAAARMLPVSTTATSVRSPSSDTIPPIFRKTEVSFTNIRLTEWKQNMFPSARGMRK